MAFVRRISTLGKNDAAVAGGKGASLGEMTQAGIPVPGGFVIVSEAFEAFIRETGLDAEIDAALDTVDHRAVHTVENASERIHALIEAAEMPKGIADDILREYKIMKAPFVAVRSSATAEDSAEAAWAGQLETFLNTTEKELLGNVKKCWASLFSPRAIFYRFEKKMRKTKVSVAVVVQEMVQSEVSGIAFSVHPVTQDRNQIIIEAGLGLGEAVVSGTITPDSFVVRKDTGEIVDRQINVQEKGLFRAKHGGSEWKVVAKNEGARPALSDEEVKELGLLVRKIERHYGFPVDIEWARAKGTWFILQSRPITTLSPRKEVHKTDFKFMWGQKQSAMITEGMLWQLKNTLSAGGSVEESGIPETLFIVRDGIFEHFMPTHSYVHISKQGQRYLRKDFPKQLRAMVNRHIKEFFAFASHVRRTNLRKLPDAELRKMVVTYQGYINRTFIFFGTSSNWWTDTLTDGIRRILAAHFKDPKTADDAFITLCTPAEADETMRERLDFTKLASSKETTEKELRDYGHRYPALFFNTYNEKEVMDFLKDRVKEERGKNHRSEQKKLESMLAEVGRKQKKIFATVKDAELKYFAETLQRSALDRYRLKHIWSGGEYACLPLMKELSRRIGVPFDDFIKTYTFTDILNGLDGKALGEKEVERRLRCFVFHHVDGETKFFSGKQAEDHIAGLLPAPETSAAASGMTIKGDIANRGRVRGKARVVFVKDLKQFQHDAKEFQKGEILVTTMTSPVMIPLIEKAVGIITDEGGICSHAAVSAREFGIPCIIATHGASARIKTGDEIELDGDAGVIRVLKTDAPPSYEFSWGERHSVMTAEMWATSYLRYRDRLANENRNVLLNVEKGHVQTYTTAEDLPAAHEAGKAMLSPAFLPKYLKESGAARETFRKLLKTVKATRLDGLTDKKLSALLSEYQSAFEHVYALFKVTQPEYPQAAADRLKELLAARFSGAELQQAFITLTTPTETDMMKEEELKATELSLRKSLTNSDIQSYGDRYAWFFFNTYDRDIAAAFLAERFRELKAIPEKERKAFLQKADDDLRKHNAAHGKILKALKNKEAVYLSKLFGILSNDRLELKKWWTGSEYLFLDFFEEIAKRLNLNVEEYFMTYRLSETFATLESGKKLSPKIRSDRRKHYAVLLDGEKVTFLESSEAMRFCRANLRPVSTEAKASGAGLHGTVANTGKASGIARLIRVEDLKELLLDMKRFRNGEIIVTTMTQPTMASMARRAAAIVTNEGGITSHASILAREFGIPCVVGTKTATDVIKDGDRIEVDADRGVVKVLGKSKPVSIEWVHYLTRPFTLLGASFWRSWYDSKYIVQILGATIDETRFMEVYPDVVRCYREKSQMEALRNSAKNIVIHDRKKLRAIYDRGYVLNAAARKILKKGWKAVPDFEAAIDLCTEMAIHATVVPFLTLAWFDDLKVTNKALRMSAEELRGESLYPRFFAEIVTPHAEHMAKKLGANPNDASLMTVRELREGSISGLKERLSARKNGKRFVYTYAAGSESVEWTDDIETRVLAIEHTTKQETAVLKGKVGYRGKVTGTARLVLTDSPKGIRFEKGDILVSINSTPALMPLIVKCAAMVTDEGGISCHAAIVSRELRKPCVMATKLATSVIRDGDRIEVDADRGTVRVLKAKK